MEPDSKDGGPDMEFDNQDNCDLDTKSESTQNSVFNDAESKKSVSELVNFFERCSSKSQTFCGDKSFGCSEEQRELAHAVKEISQSSEAPEES